MNKQYVNYCIVVSLVFLLQACSVPTIETKEADIVLPNDYQQGISYEDKTTKALIDWQSFFDDDTLIALIDTAVVNNQEMNILMQRMKVAQNEIQARSGEYKPFVNVGAGADAERVGEFTRNGSVEEQLSIRDEAFPEFLQNYQFGLNASWELDVWHKLRNATKVAAMEYMASVEGRNFLLTRLIAEVAESYYELQSLDNQLLNLQQTIEIQQQALGVVKELQAYGRETTLAIKRFEAEVMKNQSKRFQIKQKIVEAENRLNFLMGRMPQTIERDSKHFMTFKPKLIQVGIPSELLKNRPDIRLAEMHLNATKLNIDVARANFYPSFEIRAGVGFEAFEAKYLLTTPESLAISLAGEMFAPLINRNAIIADYKNASAEQIEAAYEYEQKILNAYVEVSNQLSNINNLEKGYQLKNQQVETLDDAIDISNQLFKSAHADYLEVLLTQSEALEAKLELIELKKQQISATINLYKVLGGGWKNTPRNS